MPQLPGRRRRLRSHYRHGTWMCGFAGCRRLTALQHHAGCVALLLWVQIAWRPTAEEASLISIMKKMGDNLVLEMLFYYLPLSGEVHENFFALMFIVQAYYPLLPSFLLVYFFLGIFTLFATPPTLDSLHWLPQEQDQLLSCWSFSSLWRSFSELL